MYEKFLYIICFVGIFIGELYGETIKGNESLFNCDDENTECENFGSTETTAETVSEILEEDKLYTVNVTTTVSSIASTKKTSNSETIIKPKGMTNVLAKTRNEGEICSCDLTVYSCDINCCCDLDCANIDVDKLFNCESNNRVIIKGTRYCYDGDYIRENKTRYLFEKLRDNLFCIAYENFPPVYKTDYDPIINNRIIIDDIINNNKNSRYKFEETTNYIPIKFSNDKSYRYGDDIWIIRKKLIKKLELPQTGFTGVCSFVKALKYLKNWSHSCLQISLKNNNDQLFVERFNNFSIIASPSFYGDLNFTADNQNCPTNVCLPLESLYCFHDSWKNCNKIVNSSSPPHGNCDENGNCVNVVKNIRYVVTHDGTNGIKGLKVYMKLVNVSDKYYQKYEIEYKWLGDNDSTLVYQLSGNPGYIIGKRILSGNFLNNKTDVIKIDDTEGYLSLPLATTANGICDANLRYDINFGQDLKLNCKIELSIENFSSTSCVDLQKLIVDALLDKNFANFTEFDRYSTYVPKLNYYGDKNYTVDDWAKILFDNIPGGKVLTGRLIDDKIICSGLVTSLRIDVVHRRLAEPPQPIDNYKILGIAVKFSEDEDIYWNKCKGYNCTDLLSVDVISYVNFHDVSRPSKYYFADRNNFDIISLPNDFFYPFINYAKATASSFHRSQKLISILYNALIFFVFFVFFL